MTRFCNRGGFSVLELLIAMLLSGGIFMAMLSVQKAVLNAQQREWRTRKLSADSLYALEAIKRSLRGASVLVEPAQGGSSGRLYGYINVNPDDLSARLVSDLPQEYFLYCFDSSSGTLYKYSGGYPPAWTFRSFYCGAPAERTQTREVLAGDMRNALVSYLFLRSATNSNLVNILYSLSYNSVKVTGDTSVSLQKCL